MREIYTIFVHVIKHGYYIRNEKFSVLSPAFTVRGSLFILRTAPITLNYDTLWSGISHAVASVMEQRTYWCPGQYCPWGNILNGAIAFKG